MTVETIDPWKLSDREVIDFLQSSSPLAKARNVYSGTSARIEQAEQQRTPLSPVDMRRMEIEAVIKIIKAYTDA